MKIYTKTGDCGTTGLFAGPRVAKDNPRIQAYGTVDELNALLGVVAATLDAPPKSSDQPQGDSLVAGGVQWEKALQGRIEILGLIQDIQNDLFSVGAQLATPDPVGQKMCLLKPARVTALENWIDAAESQLPPLKNFILPGGSRGSAMLHLARTVCRRAERDIVNLSHEPQVSACELLIVYLNRLSDLLFVMARFHNFQTGHSDVAWFSPGVQNEKT